MTNKPTKKDNFNTLIAIVSNQDRADRNELLTFLHHEIELLDKKTESKKPTAKQKENEGIKRAILAVLRTSEKGMTIPEIQSTAPALAEHSSQKMSALLRLLKEDGCVTSEKVKNKTYFKVC